MRYFSKFTGAGLPLLLAAVIVMLIAPAGCSSAPVTTQTSAPVTTQTSAPATTQMSVPATTQTSVPVSTPVTTLSANTLVDFIAAVQKAMPSVVKIEVTFGPRGAPGDPSAHSGAGTGWVFRENGLIVTNDHVVDGAQTVTVVFQDGTKLTPSSIQTDAGKDLAVLKVAAQNLPAATIGDSSQLQLGQPIAAIGNALNLGIRVTAGVVSQLNVPVSYNNISLTGLIETDAAINPGNSGGILINLLGEVEGIPNVGLEDPNLDVEDFSYGININEAMPVINNLIAQIP